MRKEVIMDERVQNERRKITNEAFSLIMLFLIGSVLVKQYILKESFSAYAIEFICFFGAIIYIMVRNILLGNAINESLAHKKNKLLIVMNTGVIIALIDGWDLYKKSAPYSEITLTMIMAFFVASSVGMATLILIEKLTRRRQKLIEKNLDDDEL